MKLIHPPLAALLLAGSVSVAAPAFAEVRIDMRDGRVTLDAKDASVQEILAEWARVSGARIVNAEKLMTADRVTIQLADVPEMRALEIVLRPAAGFVAAPRSASNPGTSKYDRIMVLATSTPPATAGFQQTPGMSTSPDGPMPDTFDPNGGMVRQPTYPPGYPGGVNAQPQYATQPGMMPSPYPQQIGATGGFSITQQPGGGVQVMPNSQPQQTPFGVMPGTSAVPGTIIVPTVPGATSVPPKPPGIPR